MFEKYNCFLYPKNMAVKSGYVEIIYIDNNKISYDALKKMVSEFNLPFFQNAQSFYNLFKNFFEYGSLDQTEKPHNYIILYANNYYYVGIIGEGESQVNVISDMVRPNEDLTLWCNILNSKDNSILKCERNFYIVDKDRISQDNLLEIVNKLNEQLQK